MDRNFLKNSQQFLDYLNHENNIEAPKEECFKRKRKTIEALTKYETLEVAEVDSQYFGWIPNLWLERGMTSQAYGLLKLGGNPVTLVMGRIALAFFRMLQLRYRLRG